MKSEGCVADPGSLFRILMFTRISDPESKNSKNREGTNKLRLLAKTICLIFPQGEEVPESRSALLHAASKGAFFPVRISKKHYCETLPRSFPFHFIGHHY